MGYGDTYGDATYGDPDFSGDLRARGNLDLFSSGDVLPEDLAYVLTLPDTSSVTLTGAARIYDGNPVAFACAGGLDVGSAGRAVRVVSDYFGTFDDFAYFDSALPGHPFYAWIVATSSDRNTPTGDLQSAWKRFTRHVVPPPGARFAVPKIGLSGGVGNTQYLDAFQMQVVPINLGSPETPAFTKPRRLNVRVRPTRLNYSVSPTVAIGSAGVTVTPDTARSVAGRASCKVVVASTASSPISVQEDQYLPVEEGESLAVSCQALTEGDLDGTYRIAVDYFTEALTPVATVHSDGEIHDRAEWKTLSLVTVAPKYATRARVTLAHSDVAPASVDTFWIDRVLVEKSTSLGEYFDGSYGDDYLWRQDGIPWSYFYEDRVQRNYILVRTLRENVPLGVSVGDPLYAEETNGLVSPYGFGLYGYGLGPYGG